jgi:hypothetical protein
MNTIILELIPILQIVMNAAAHLLRFNSDDLYRAEIRSFLRTGRKFLIDRSLCDIAINPEFFYDPAE